MNKYVQNIYHYFYRLEEFFIASKKIQSQSMNKRSHIFTRKRNGKKGKKKTSLLTDIFVYKKG